MSSKLILASASPRRMMLLKQAGVVPDSVVAADVDETAHKNEMPRALANRLALAKAQAVHLMQEHSSSYILAADTVVAVGRRILPKAETLDDVYFCLNLISGRTHRVYTSVVLITPLGKIRQKLVETKVQFKRLSKQDIQLYIDSDEWRGKAGGYAIQGLAGVFVTKLIGSYFNVVGLPLYETVNLLNAQGFVKHE